MSLAQTVSRTAPARLRAFHTSLMAAAGHSKWQNIRHDKAKNDARKSKEAYAMATRITASVKSGGTEGNAQLATLMEKAKKLNVTKKIIENAVKRGTGELSNEGNITSVVTYEFMGPGGVAFIVEANTDNKNRTFGLIKHAMSKFSASLSPCQYMFQRKGEIIFEALTDDEELDAVLEVAIDIGAEDVEEYEDVEDEYNGEKLFRIITDAGELNKVSNSLSAQGYKLRDSKTVLIADLDLLVEYPEEQEKALSKCIEMLDEIDEVTNYYSNIRD